jgi:hypothetical protein
VGRHWLAIRIGSGHCRRRADANGGCVAPANGEAPLIDLYDEIYAAVHDPQLRTRNNAEFPQLIGEEIRANDLNDGGDSI